EAAPDHDRLDVEEVDRGGDARAEGGDRPVDEHDGHVVAVLERAGPDAAREPRAAVLLHDLEELRLAPALDEMPGAGLHRAAAGVGLEAAAPPARTVRSAGLHDDVSDLAG